MTESINPMPEMDSITGLFYLQTVRKECGCVDIVDMGRFVLEAAKPGMYVVEYLEDYQPESDPLYTLLQLRDDGSLRLFTDYEKLVQAADDVRGGFCAAHAGE